MMMRILISLFFLLKIVNGHVVLSEKILNLTRTSAHLSAMAYDHEPDTSGFKDVQIFIEEPDQALVASTDGYCFAAFRGTTLTYSDWMQNLQVGNEDICHGRGPGKHCCSTRSGFYDAYKTSYKKQLVAALRKCAKQCKNRDECVVITGHSQGGAIAAVAGIELADLNPYVITFGQPPTVDAPCSLVTSERWYRYVNTKDSQTLTFGIVYDPVPFAPGLGADNFGHMILLSGDASGVAYVGLDAQDFFGPLNVNGFQAHSMIAPEDSDHPGYLDRVDAIMDHYAEHGQYPVRDNGYLPNSLCTEDIECESGVCDRELRYSWKRCVGIECKTDTDCTDTGRCDSGICVPKLGSCQPCDENADCESGICTWRFVCTNMEGLLDNECECNINSDCQSGRCEGWSPPICEARLAEGAYCNEDSDCLSNDCSWRFRCRGGIASTVRSASRSIVAPATLETEDTDSSRHMGVLVAVAALLIVGILLVITWQTGRRRGYEEIPARFKEV